MLYHCFFFNDTATTEIYTTYDTLSLHDALPILAHPRGGARLPRPVAREPGRVLRPAAIPPDLQAAADGRGVGPLLPARPLLSRRGPSQRPPARVHTDRHRGVVRPDGRRARLRRDRPRRPVGRGRSSGRAAVPAHHLARSDGAVRHRQAGPAL